MSRITEHRDAAYWVHSAPDDEDQAGEQAVCPGRHPADAPAAGQPVWCREHATEITSAVRAMPDLAASCLRLPDGKLLGQPAQSEIRAASTDPASPSPAWDAVEYVAQWAATAAYQLAMQVHDEDPGRFRPNTGVPIPHLTRSCTYLAGRMTAWLSGPEAGKVGAEALNVERRLRAQAGLDRLVHWLPMPCIQCGRKALRRRDGQETVECAACQRRWPWDQYEFLAKAYADGVESTG